MVETSGTAPESKVTLNSSHSQVYLDYSQSKKVATCRKTLPMLPQNPPE